MTMMVADEWDVDGELVIREDGHWYCSCTADARFCVHVRAAMKMKAGKVTGSSPVEQGPAPLAPGDDGAGAVPHAAPAPPSRSDRSLDELHVPGEPPLPEWVKGLRDHQWTAVDEVVDAFKAGAKVVWLDAPTGSGKTLIGEAVRRKLAREQLIQKALYVCSDKALQDQFLADFDYAQVLKGRANYPTLDGAAGVDCSDCTGGAGSGCNWCHDRSRCPYVVAKDAALGSPLAVLNTAYLLAEANSGGKFSGRGLTVLDECDVLEQVLMGWVQFHVSERQLRGLGVTAPKKGSHLTTIVKWIGDDLRPAVIDKIAKMRSETSLWGDLKHGREVRGLQRLLVDVDRVKGISEGDGEWVRDNDAGPSTLKPVRVDGYGDDVLWRHSRRWLCMSATIISPDQMVESLGVEGEWATVQVPMTFDVANRPVYLSAVASMTQKNRDMAVPEMVKGVRAVLRRHEGERVLVHAVSYQLAGDIVAGLSGCGRRVVTYRHAGGKDAALDEYRRTEGAVLVASSMDRGVDLKDDDCRVVVIAKVPFPYLGDPQVGKRMHGPGGQEWYAVQTVRSIVQMSGRGVRSANDWCATYILDSQFGGNVYKNHKRLFPKWWRGAVEVIPPRQLLRD